MVNNFTGKYRFLSNFYIAPVMFEGQLFQNNEAAFQAAKVTDKAEREKFTTMNPSEAKRAGRHVALRKDWENVKTDIMYQICLDKFTRNPSLRESLLKTGNEKLEEENTWGDRIWGTVDGKGENRLGKILMRIRQEINNTPS